MIVIVDALNRSRFEEVLDQMFRLRARVFEGRLGWEVTVSEGREIDQFDALDPAYVIGLDDDGHVVACARLLQTTGPHMLSDVFHGILRGESPLRSATLWESTRFCVDTERLGRGRGPNTVSHATIELMIGTLEYARSAGIEDIVTVIDPIMDRLLKRSNNAPYGYVGEATPMGKVPAMAALLDCTPERIARLRAFAGIEGEVLASEEAALARFQRVRAKAAGTGLYAPVPVAAADVVAYCRAQIADAADPQEKAAALELVAEVARTTGLAALSELVRCESH
ncbi:MAG: GNAT family N-acetyltransferase [Rhodobacteraceae bacterium]|nr:GNAT family N-acetyltransferase [Paracoccaceae bacterium]